MSWGFILDLYFSNKDSVAGDAAVAAAPSSPDPGLSCDPTLWLVKVSSLFIERG